MKKNEAQQPKIDPILPNENGKAIPSIELLTFVDDGSLASFVSLAEDVERSAKTSDDGRKILQHRLYNK